MSLSSHVAVNARYERRPITGVERYAREVTRRLGDRARLVRPPGSSQGLGGHLWEQVALPRMLSARELLWSPANTGPLSVRHQVVTIHDISFADHPEWFDRRFVRWYHYLVPRLATRVRHVITVSEFSKARLIERFHVPATRITVIANGVDARFRPAESGLISSTRARHHLDAPYVLFVGSLEPRKNLATLFRAWPLIRRDAPEVVLVVAGHRGPSFRGTGFDRPPEGVQFIGSVDDDVLAALYSGATASVLPSLYEGSGLTALEAMACGAPLVASNATALPETVGDAGLLVNPLDPDSIADGVRRVVASPALRDTLRQRGLERARELTWERTAAATWQALEAAMEKRPPAR